MERGHYKIDGRLESYSCKMIASEKKMLRTLTVDHEPVIDPNHKHALSPPQSGYLVHSPSRQSSYNNSDDGEGEMRDTISTKTLFYLTQTLNVSFQPDYDFSGAKGEEFSREPSAQWVMNAVDPLLFTGGSDPILRQQLWMTIDEEIALRDCDIYSYNPDLTSDPFAEEGCLWSFNYFFYNKKLKRLVFFSCRASSVNRLRSVGDDDNASDEVMMFDDDEEAVM